MSSFRHAYHKSLVYKLFVASKPNVIHNNLDQVLEIIRHFARISRGMPQILYLVGWQFDGHDSKYPSWAEVNPRLQRQGDASARESLLWLMAEAKKHNATVSLHINMCDAYANSPLWEKYVDQDLLVRHADGTLKKGGIWGGEQSYLVCKTREWASGVARQRIDSLLELLPLAEAGTIHIDVFQPMPSPGHGIGREQELETMKQILGYWQSCGVDVTKEWWHHEFAGLVPYVWHFNMDEASRLRYAPWEACGGGSAWNMRQSDRTEKPGGFSVMPEAGCLYEEAWGHSVDCDVRDNLQEISQQFFLRTLPWQYLNQRRPIRHSQTPQSYEVEFGDGLVSHVRTMDRHLHIQHGEVMVVDGQDVLTPIWWRENQCLAYSQEGSHKSWRLPTCLQGAARVVVETIWGGETGKSVVCPVEEQKMKLTLRPEEAVAIYPQDH